MQGRCTISSIVYPFFRICHFHCCSKVPVFHVTDEGGTCFPYEAPHRPKPAIFVENRNGRIQPSKHTNLKLIRVFIIIIILLFCTVLIWLGKFPNIFLFLSKKRNCTCFPAQKKKQQSCAQFRMTRRRSMCFYIHIYF